MTHPNIPGTPDNRPRFTVYYSTDVYQFEAVREELAHQGRTISGAPASGWVIHDHGGDYDVVCDELPQPYIWEKERDPLDMANLTTVDVIPDDMAAWATEKIENIRRWNDPEVHLRVTGWTTRPESSDGEDWFNTFVPTVVQLRTTHTLTVRTVDSKYTMVGLTKQDVGTILGDLDSAQAVISIPLPSAPGDRTLTRHIPIARMRWIDHETLTVPDTGPETPCTMIDLSVS